MNAVTADTNPNSKFNQLKAVLKTAMEERGHRVKRTPSTKHGVLIVSILEYLNMICNDKVFAYAHNRGLGGSISKTFTSNIARGFNPNSLGIVSVARNCNNNNTTKNLVLMDAHNRTYALMLRYISNTHPEIDLDFKFPVRICDSSEGIELYKSLNVTRTHTAVSQFTNPDMAIGHFIENRIMPNVTSSGIDLIPKAKLYTQIAYMIFAKQRYGTTPFNYAEAYATRISVGKQLRQATPADNAITIDDEAVKDIVSAVNFVGDYAESFDKLCNETKQNGKHAKGMYNSKLILGKSPWLGTVMVNKMYNYRQFSTDANVLAEQSTINFINLKKYSNSIVSGCRDESLKIINKLSKALKGKLNV